MWLADGRISLPLFPRQDSSAGIHSQHRVLGGKISAGLNLYLNHATIDQNSEGVGLHPILLKKRLHARRNARRIGFFVC